ncbi:hypothetical protein ABB37_01205 [Leptomonas pyrrhocoris]|uniref:Nudix hydrolase domain-containing protein n=1 Tax=Leptomonas pyrrhocoris TaxID=157538 RepID=A0A0N0VGZ2_LEPPY|nr:hypothetical protein ABB37_01205 [Leptomonas pyrrhocoris]KPA84701.1 hypothetical protein ABB37_01205 [Leptomonas pyrrhocoris]|eukprot:XP_015663140.1 hypothetical protein ABB37_01205 [Leptomonas pyrrhocoris]
MERKRSRAQEVEEKNVVIRGADGRAYRRSVQLFFVNERGHFLICCPVGGPNRNYRQTVQGGSIAGETPLETAVREAWEELGLDITQQATFITEVMPPASALSSSSPNSMPSVLGDAVLTNEQGELISEDKVALRYASKKWRKQGIFGQEMYPLLFFLPSHGIQFVQVKSRSRGVRQEFNAVYWGSLVELAQRAPPVKQQVMANVCPMVAASVLPFLTANGYSLDGVTDYCAAGPA